MDANLDVPTIMRMEQLYVHMYGKLGESAPPLSASTGTGFWLMHLLTAMSWLTARLCASLISGPGTSPCEAKLAGLLSSPLFAAGLDNEELLGESTSSIVTPAYAKRKPPLLRRMGM